MSRERIIRLFSVLLIALFIGSIVWNIVQNGSVLDAILYDDQLDTGMDFFNSMAYTRGRVPYTQYGTVYPPLANVLFLTLMHAVPTEVSDRWGSTYDELISMRGTGLDMRLYQGALFPFLLFIAFSAAVLFALAYRGIRGEPPAKALFAFAMITSLGVLYAVERGNISLTTLCLVLFYIQFQDSPSRVVSELALLSLAAATGLKLYPVVFGVTLLLSRQYGKALRAILYGLVLFLAPFFLFEGFASIKQFFQLLLAFNDPGEAVSPIGVSLMQIAETALKLFHFNETSPAGYAAVLAAVGKLTYLILAVAVALCFVTRYRWKALLLLALTTILIPNRSGIYVTCYLIVPVIAFLNAQPEPSRLRYAYMALFVPLLAFFPYVTTRIGGYQAVQLVVECALAALLVLVMADVLHEAAKRVGRTHTYVRRRRHVRFT